MKEIIRKYLRGKSTASEHGQLLEWMREDDHLKKFQEIKGEWESKAFDDVMPESSQKSWNAVQNQLLVATQSKLQKSVRSLQFFKYAAVLVFAVFIAAAGVKLAGIGEGTDHLQYSIVKADAGQIANVVLPDQTEVWLNSGSYIRYSNKFASKNREIELHGEAYFSVTKNPEMPLVVTGSSVEVKVLGTKFNVSAYPEDPHFSVALEEGKVELVSSVYKNFNKPLEPDHLAVFNKNTKELEIKQVKVKHFTSWKDGMINIYNLPLEEVVQKLSKRYNQQFVVEEEVKQIRYTYTIKNETLPEVLKLMETITPIEVVQAGDVINLKQRKQKTK